MEVGVCNPGLDQDSQRPEDHRFRFSKSEFETRDPQKLGARETK